MRGDHPLYMLTFFLLIIFFTYFYVAITFNPTEVADNMKKYGGFIPGIRAGQADRGVPRLRAVPAHAAGIALPCPDRADPAVRVHRCLDANQNFPFGGTSLLIMVGVGLDTVKQIESQLQQRNYEGFLR